MKYTLLLATTAEYVWRAEGQVYPTPSLRKDLVQLSMP